METLIIVLVPTLLSLLPWLIFWFFCGIVAAVIAKHKGRSGVGWFCLGMLVLGPLAVVLVVVLPSRDAQAEVQARMYGASGDFRRCPVCAEAIRTAAQKCRYCHSDVGGAVIKGGEGMQHERGSYGAWSAGQGVAQRILTREERNRAQLGTRWQERV